jgi:hypothetical protein
MSELEYSLQLFGFDNLSDLTTESLKQAFKEIVVRLHPDRGGSDIEFDKILSSYAYLLSTLQRITGGRTTLQTITSIDELKELRSNEIINSIFEEFDSIEFNKHFEELNNPITNILNGEGYTNWLKSDNNIEDISGNNTPNRLDLNSDSNKFNLDRFNNVFTNNASQTKQDIRSTQSLIIHPDQMAYISGNTLGGTLIVQEKGGSFTSELFTKPQYVDLYSAYEVDNIICNKVDDSSVAIDRNLDDIIHERNSEIKPLNDEELTTIAEFEKKRFEKQTSDFKNVIEFFNNTDNNNTTPALLLF